MMKTLLALSLIANLVLGILYFTKKPEVRERLIIETHKQAPEPKETVSAMSVRPKPPVEKPKEVKPEKSEERRDPPEFINMDSHELQDSGERMEAQRLEFMTVELGMTEEKIAEHNRIREEFFRESSKFWSKDPMGELSFDERRKLIDMEEDLHRKLEKLHGKENWEKYQKFREEYNKRGYKKQMEDGQPFIFMAL